MIYPVRLCWCCYWLMTKRQEKEIAYLSTGRISQGGIVAAATNLDWAAQNIFPVNKNPLFMCIVVNTINK